MASKHLLNFPPDTPSHINMQLNLFKTVMASKQRLIMWTFNFDSSEGDNQHKIDTIILNNLGTNSNSLGTQHKNDCAQADKVYMKTTYAKVFTHLFSGHIFCL